MFSVLRAKKLFSKKSERDAADGTSAAGAHAPAHKSRSNLLQTRHFTFTNHLTPCPLCFCSSRAFRSSSPPHRCRFGCCLGLRSDCTHTPCKATTEPTTKNITTFNHFCLACCSKAVGFPCSHSFNQAFTHQLRHHLHPLAPHLHPLALLLHLLALFSVG